jgi:hypothetical protein
MSRSAGWAIYPWFRMLEIVARWTARADRARKYKQSRRRASDIKFGRRASDLTSPGWLPSLHIHWLPTILFCALFVILDWLVRGMMVR